MKLALVGGSFNDTLIKELSLNLDNIDIHCFKTLQEFSVSVVKRHNIYNRVLVVSTCARNNTEHSLTNLNTMLLRYSESTGVILICKKGADDEIGKTFSKVFASPLSLAVELSTVSLSTLEDIASQSIDNIKTGYSYFSSDVVETVEEMYTEDKEQGASVPSRKKKKKGLFSSLFTKSRDKKKIDKLESEHFKDEDDDSYIEKVDNNGISESVDYSATTNTEQDPDEFVGDEGIDSNVSDSSQQESSQEVDYDSVSAFKNDDIDLSEPINNDITSTSNDLEEYKTESEMESNENVSILENLGDSNSSAIEEVIDLSIADLKSDILASPRKKPNLPMLDNSDVELTDIDDDDSISVINLEQKYQEQNSKVKVVEKVIEKKVVVNTKSSLVQEIIDGKLHKTILVTGDRGSGVTSTAYEIAKFFAEKVPVLYVDGDLKTHGIVNYLDHEELARFEKTQLHGTDLCKSEDRFDNYVIRYEKNLFFLLSDYGVEIKDEQFHNLQSIVAEKANEYGVVVIDVPLSYLHLCEDLVLTGVTTICLEATKRGFMNTLFYLDDSKLNKRYKRTIASKGSFLYTRVKPNLDTDALKSHIDSNFYESSDVSWLDMRTVIRSNKVTEALLNDIMEG